MARKLSWKK